MEWIPHKGQSSGSLLVCVLFKKQRFLRTVLVTEKKIGIKNLTNNILTLFSIKLLYEINKNLWIY